MQPFGPYRADGRQQFRCSRWPWCDRYAGWIKPNKRKVRSSNCGAGLGFGDHLAKLFSRIDFKQKGCGNCPKRQEALNRWSWNVFNAVWQIITVPINLLSRLLCWLAGVLVKVFPARNRREE